MLRGINVSLVPSTKGFGAALDKQIGPEVDKAARDAGTRAGDGFTSSFGAGLGKLAAIAATAFAGLQVGGFIKDSITAASDLSETVNKVAVVFGDSAPIVQEWGKTAATALGQSQQQALEAAGTFGNLFRAMGLTSDVSADMSTKLINLAGDLASFNNANPADVLVALKSGLVGETEPLRQFGVNLNDIRIKAEAARLGLVSATVDQDKLSSSSEAADKAARKVADAMKEHGAASQEFADATRDAEQANAKLADVMGGKMPTQLDAATKAQAVYSLILSDTTLAQGDFARTSNGLANQQRILAAQFKDASAKIGQAFLPVALKVVTLLTSKGIPAFSKFGELVATKLAHGIDVVTVALRIFRKELDSTTVTTKGFHSLNDIFAHLGDLVSKARDFGRTVIEAFVAGFTGQHVDLSGFVGVIVDIGAKVGVLVSFLKDDVPAAVKAFTDGFANSADTLDKDAKFKALVSFGETLKSIVTLIKDNKDVFLPLATALTGFAAALLVVSKVSPVLGILSGAFSSLGTVVGILTSPLGIIVGLLAALGVGAFVAYKKFTPFKAAVDSVAQTFKRAGFGAAVDEAGTQFGRLFEIVKPKLIEFRDQAVQWLKDHGPEIFAGVGTAIGGVFSFVGTEVLQPLGSWIKDTAAPWLKDKLTKEWGPAFFNWITETAIPGTLGKLPQFIDAITQWIEDHKKEIREATGKIADAAVDWIENTAIPELKKRLPGITATLLQFFVDDVLPLGRAIGGLLVGALVESIVTHLPDLFLKIPGELALAGLGILAGIVAGIIGPEATAKLEEISTNLIAFVSGLPQRIADAAIGMWHGITDAFNALLSGDISADRILAFFTDLPGKISAAAVGMWDGIYEAFKGALNLIIRAWNGLEFTVGKFHVPGTDKDFGGITIGTPDIPELAGGGVFNSPFTGMLKLAETPSARPEIVTPQKLLAQTFRKELATVGAGSGGGVQFGDIVVNGAQASPSSIADAVFAKAGWLHFTGRREL